jgi:hypothetical protein
MGPHTPTLNEAFLRETGPTVCSPSVLVLPEYRTSELEFFLKCTQLYRDTREVGQVPHLTLLSASGKQTNSVAFSPPLNGTSLPLPFISLAQGDKDKGVWGVEVYVHGLSNSATTSITG